MIPKGVLNAVVITILLSNASVSDVRMGWICRMRCEVAGLVLTRVLLR
jgi:hypothetical protein